MVISILFSAEVYRGFLLEFRRGLRNQSFRLPLIQGQQTLIIPFRNLPSDIENEIYEEARQRILLQLIEVNLGILITAGISGYFLAGRTLKPIELMVNEQKRFVADASHELRTPLTVMKTETEVALREKNLDLKDAKVLLKSNLEEVDKMQSLSNYLLELSRYEDKNNKPPMEKLNLEEIVKSVVQKLTPVAKKGNIEIITDVQHMEIMANRESIVELLSILLDNAIKYSHQGSKVIISIKKDKGAAIISIKDFGIGIKENELPFIFNRFYRADTSRSKVKTDGYGLGLSIAKSIVELHEGKITASSIPEKGTTFTIFIPLGVLRVN
jgi:signal transduction histidine kinase